MEGLGSLAVVYYSSQTFTLSIQAQIAIMFIVCLFGEVRLSFSMPALRKSFEVHGTYQSSKKRAFSSSKTLWGNYNHVKESAMLLRRGSTFKGSTYG